MEQNPAVTTPPPCFIVATESDEKQAMRKEGVKVASQKLSPPSSTVVYSPVPLREPVGLGMPRKHRVWGGMNENRGRPPHSVHPRVRTQNLSSVVAFRPIQNVPVDLFFSGLFRMWMRFAFPISNGFCSWEEHCLTPRPVPRRDMSDQFAPAKM